MTGFPLYHCDDVTHGYCFHLDDEEPELTEEQRLTIEDIKNTGLDYLETIEEVDEEIQETRSDIENHLEAVSSLEDDLTDLWKLRRLLEDKNRPRPFPQYVDRYTLPLGLTDKV